MDSWRSQPQEKLDYRLRQEEARQRGLAPAVIEHYRLVIVLAAIVGIFIFLVMLVIHVPGPQAPVRYFARVKGVIPKAQKVGQRTSLRITVTNHGPAIPDLTLWFVGLKRNWRVQAQESSRDHLSHRPSASGGDTVWSFGRLPRRAVDVVTLVVVPKRAGTGSFSLQATANGAQPPPVAGGFGQWSARIAAG